MIWLDTEKKMKWLINSLENNELQLISRKLTEDDNAEIQDEIAKYKIMRNKAISVDEHNFASVPV